MKMLQLSILSVILRLYLVMVIVLIAGFTRVWILGLLALPVFFSVLMGVRIRKVHPPAVSGNRHIHIGSRLHHVGRQ